MISRAPRLSNRKLRLQRTGDPGGDLILQRKQIARIPVETLGPEVPAGLGIDQLGVYADLIPMALDTAFENITHAQFTTQLLCIDRFALIGERGISGDHQAPLDTRDIGRKILGNPVREILLPWV